MESIERIERLQDHLRAVGMAAALLFHSRDVFYYTGTAQPAWLAVTPEDFRLYVRSGLDFARADTGWGDDRLTSARNPEAIAAAMFPNLAAGTPIGTEIDMMPVPLFDQVRRAFPRVDLVDLSPAILAQRALKSAAEVAAVEKACAAVDAGHQAAVREIHADMSELEASALMENAHRLAGHEGAYFMRQADFSIGRGPFASGPNIARISGIVFTVSGVGLSPAVPAGASRRRMAEGDLFVVDIPTCVEGYHADQSRTYAVARAAPRALDLHGRLKETADRTMADLRPGVTASEVFEMASRHAAAAGIGAEFLAFPGGKRSHFVGHGVGLELNEPPLLARGNPAPLAARMVLAIEMQAYAEGILVKLEDTVLLREEGGCRILTRSPRELMVVG